MHRRQICLGTNSEYFPEGTHMCLIYDNEQERREIIGRFICDGLAQGERVGYFAHQVSEAQDWLGTSVSTKISGVLEIADALQIYCPQGFFEPQQTLAQVRAYYNEARARHFPGARISGEMSWALNHLPGTDRLVEYEALLNHVCASHPLTPICQYDARHFDGSTLLKIIKVHPLVIVRGQIVRNPYYLKPEDFLLSQAY
jgi:hypothetical protein